MVSKCEALNEKILEQSREEKVQQNHKTDSLILLSFLILLIVSVITIWIFKHKRLRFVHETSCSLIYGLILGVIFYNLPIDVNKVTTTLQMPQSKTNCAYQLPPDNIILEMNLLNRTSPYTFKYRHVLNDHESDAKDLSRKATFDAEIFFNLLLPPIIFCAGYNMKKKHFFENLGAIASFAFLGTILSSLTIGGLCYGLSRTITSISDSIGFGECLLFGSFISATDPVTVLAIFNDINIEVDLYAFVFGESVLNDAVAIVLVNSVEQYGKIANNGEFNPFAILIAAKSFMTVFLGALSIGCVVGICTALVTKYTYLRDHPLLETSLFFLMSYCSFLIAEVAGASGIVASLFCGITQAHYTYNNLSEESQKWTKGIFELMSFLSENFVFVYIGVSNFTFRDHNWQPRFICIAIFAIIVGRAVNVYILSAMLNLGRKNKIKFNHQHMLMFAGVRGAMAFALAIRNTSSKVRQMFFSTTLVIVMVTVFICGGLTLPMINFLKIRIGKDNEITDSIPEPADDTTISDEQVLDLNERHKKKAFLIRMFAKLDCQFIKPLLTHSPPLLIDTCPLCCFTFAKFLTTSEQISRNSHLRISKNNISMDMTGDNMAYKSDRDLTSFNPGLPINVADNINVDINNHFKKHLSDQEFILTDTDDNAGYIEGEESGLYIQEYSAIPNTNSV
uniref:Sodium/hydrogen exchanger n=1 Tax=Schmidtea mediterranea TaxID=79327 RepID=A0A0H3YIW8_SCHMD|nr:slc9a-2 [Schmidtea mediterranea]